MKKLWTAFYALLIATVMTAITAAFIAPTASPAVQEECYEKTSH